jgi:hypothetical protein
VIGSTFTIRDGLRTDGTNTVDITAIGSEGAQLDISTISIPAPVGCSYSVENGQVTLGCTGGLDQLSRIEYIINGQNFTVSGFPITISTSQLSQSQTNTVILRLFRSDNTLITTTTFNIEPSQFVRFSVRCSGRYIRESSGLALVISCENSSDSTQSISSLRYSVNGGPELTGLHTVEPLVFVDRHSQSETV